MAKQQTHLTASDIQTLVSELPRMRAALINGMQLVGQLLDDLAEVVRAIPPELIEEAARKHVETLLKEADNATPSQQPEHPRTPRG